MQARGTSLYPGFRATFSLRAPRQKSKVCAINAIVKSLVFSRKLLSVEMKVKCLASLVSSRPIFLPQYNNLSISTPETFIYQCKCKSCSLSDALLKQHESARPPRESLQPSLQPPTSITRPRRLESDANWRRVHLSRHRQH
jgi:hypothetical protein